MVHAQSLHRLPQLANHRHRQPHPLAPRHRPPDRRIRSRARPGAAVRERDDACAVDEAVGRRGAEWAVVAACDDGGEGAGAEDRQGGAVRGAGVLQFFYHVAVHDVQWLGDAECGCGGVLGVYGVWGCNWECTYCCVSLKVAACEETGRKR